MTIPPVRPPDPAALARLHADLHGHVVLPDHADYDARRGVWNAAANAAPAVIARPADAAEVARCVAFAREHGLPVAVRSGGHSPAGYGTGSGLVVDLGRMKGIRVDPARRTAVVESGLTWQEVADALHPHGLALTSGDVGTVGVGGLAQGGGIGWFVRKHGLTIDRVRAMRLVTADGEVLDVDAARHPDLFWALRGGGANFGVITRFEFDLHEGGQVLGGAVFYDAADARGILRAYAEHARRAPDELSTQAVVIAAPPAPFVPAEMVGRPLVGILMCHCGDRAEGERIVAPLRGLGTPVADLVGPMPYPDIFALTEVGQRRGFRHASRSQFMTELGEDAVDALVARSLEVVDPGTLVQLRVLGGAMARVPHDATAFAHRDKPFVLMIDHMSPDESGDEAAARAHAATEHVWNGVRRWAAGTYGNFLAIGEEDRVGEAYDATTAARLAEIKARFDPGNVFRRNVNILPVGRKADAALA